MYIKDYVEATYATLVKQPGTNTALASLQRYLSKRGLTKLYPAILRGLAEKIRRKQVSTLPVVMVAREADLKRHEIEIVQALSKLTSGGEHEVRIDKTMIGGFVIKNRDTRIDRSYKNTLLHAYHRLTDRV